MEVVVAQTCLAQKSAYSAVRVCMSMHHIGPTNSAPYSMPHTPYSVRTYSSQASVKTTPGGPDGSPKARGQLQRWINYVILIGCHGTPCRGPSPCCGLKLYAFMATQNRSKVSFWFCDRQLAPWILEGSTSSALRPRTAGGSYPRAKTLCREHTEYYVRSRGRGDALNDTAPALLCATYVVRLLPLQCEPARPLTSPRMTILCLLAAT